MSPLSRFYEPVRAFLGDFQVEGAPWPRYRDDAILPVLRALVEGGQLDNAIGAPYALSADRLWVDPVVDNANTFHLLVLQACIVFARAGGGKQSFKTRALSVSTDGNPGLLWGLEGMLYKLENGSAFSCWQSYADWAEGVTGLTMWHNLVELNVAGPMMTVSAGSEGVL